MYIMTSRPRTCVSVQAPFEGVTFDVHSLYTVVVGNMLTNESRILFQGHAKLKNDLLSLKTKKSLLEHEMSKLEDCLTKSQRNQDVEGSQVVRDLRSKNARILEEVYILRSVAASDLEQERDFLLTKYEEASVLSFKLKAASLEKTKFVKDFLPSVVKKLFESVSLKY
ncbi:hypothetical protein Tco_0103922 [Tanacetum coccineum]